MFCDDGYICHCGEPLDDEDELKAHMVLKHGYFGFCNICNKGFRSRRGKEGHMLVHERRNVCHICGTATQTKYHLTRHLKTHDKIETQNYTT